MIYKQRKYCEDCKVFYEYTDYDSQDDSEPCPINPAHTVRDFTVLSELPCGSAFFPVDDNTTFGKYKVLTIATGATDEVSFMCPCDAEEVHKIWLVGITQNGGPGKNIDFVSQYGAGGEQYNNHTETDTASTYDLGNAGDIIKLDITDLFPDIESMDACGLEIKHNAIGGNNYYLGIFIQYKPQGS